jgi:hypothetical protein
MEKIGNNKSIDVPENRTWITLENNTSSHLRTLILFFTMIMLTYNDLIVGNKQLALWLIINWMVLSCYIIYQYFTRYQYLKMGISIQTRENNYVYGWIVIYVIISFSIVFWLHLLNK